MYYNTTSTGLMKVRLGVSGPFFRERKERLGFALKENLLIGLEVCTRLYQSQRNSSRMAP